jgi:4-hydroxybenzoyl-CoA reductase subunit beta
LQKCIEKVVEVSGWKDKFRKLPYGRGVGLACSCYLTGAGLPIYWNNMPQSGVQLKLDRSGLVTVFCGSTEIGQGSDSILGNLCVDTRCFYYDQTYEWRQSIRFCLKKDGDTCWVAPGSSRCWAVSSTDLAPVMLALNARIHLLSSEGDRVIDAAQMYTNDGVVYLAKHPNEIVTAIDLPAVNGEVAAFQKLRRRGSIDFPILNVAVWLRPAEDRKTIEDARIAIGGITSAPFLSRAAANALTGREMTGASIDAAAQAARLESRPLDNTDLDFSWRRAMVEVWVRRALEQAALRLQLKTR